MVPLGYPGFSPRGDEQIGIRDPVHAENEESMYFFIKNDVQGIDKSAFSW